jgi:hypothetical protein
VYSFNASTPLRHLTESNQQRGRIMRTALMFSSSCCFGAISQNAAGLGRAFPTTASDRGGNGLGQHSDGGSWLNWVVRGCIRATSRDGKSG